MNKNVIIVIGVLVLGLKGFSQQNTSSPYSYFGLGQVLFNGTQDIKAMGGLSIKADSIALNLSNPASYSELKLTNFSVGGTSVFNKMKTETASDKAKRTYLDYLAIGIPMGKFGASFGLMPYSSTGYRLVSNDTWTDPQDGQSFTVSQNFNGEGSINRVFGGFAYKFTKNLSFGVNLEYNFGNITNEIYEKINGIQLGTREINESQVKGFSSNFGLIYKEALKNGHEIYSGFTYAPKASLTAVNSRNIATYVQASNGAVITSDVVQFDLADTKLVIPTKFSLGVGYGKKNKWMVGSEVTFLQNKDMTNRFADIAQNYDYENAQKYSIGGFYIPKYDSFSGILNRAVYRAGFRYSKTGLVLNDKSIEDYGINFGVGLPVGISKIDLGFEFGQRGTVYNGLIQENYFNISIGLSLADKWFQKTYID